MIGPSFALAAAVALSGVLLAGRAPAQLEPEGDEFRVNSYTTGQQILPQVSHASDGRFVVVWASYGPDGSSGGVVAQRFAADGATLGKEFVVNTYTTNAQTQPAVGTDGNGRFVVVWTSTPAQDGAGLGVFGQRFSATGRAQGSEFQVNAHTTGGQQQPDIAVQPDGSFITIWRDSSSRDGQGSGIFGRRFSADGSAVGNDFRINSGTANNQVQPALAASGDGSFVVAFASYGADDPADPATAGVVARRFAANGSALGDDFVVNTYTTGMQTSPDVAVQPGGGFVVVWEDMEQFQHPSIVGRLFDPSGVPVGDEFLIRSDATFTRERPRVAASGDGSFTVTWESSPQDGSSRGLYAQRFSASAGLLGGEFQVNTFTAGSQYDAGISDDGSGRIAIVWQSPQDGSADGVYAQRYVATGSENVCGDPTADGLVSATDALFALNAAVGLVSCPLCECDVNGSATLSASDALSLLQFSVGQPTSLFCPPCG